MRLLKKTTLNVDIIFDRMGMDIVMGLPTTNEGYHAILVVVENLTKFTWAFPLKQNQPKR
jgi:hypothetical protein